MSEITRHLSFSDWLISLSIIFSRSIHTVTMVRFPSFLQPSTHLLYLTNPSIAPAGTLSDLLRETAGMVSASGISFLRSLAGYSKALPMSSSCCLLPELLPEVCGVAFHRYHLINKETGPQSGNSEAVSKSQK